METSRVIISIQSLRIQSSRKLACVLLRLDDRVEESDIINSSPLARYAAEHWVTHSRDENVSSRLRRSMEYLFDADKPYFAAWLQLHDIDTATPSRSAFHPFTPIYVYYAALCGFQDLVEHFIANNPDQYRWLLSDTTCCSIGGRAGGHFRTAKFLHGKVMAMVHTRMSQAIGG